MSPLGRIFGRGRAIENLLKKAEDSFGHGDWEKCAQLANDLKIKINPEKPGKFASELLRAYYLEAAAHYKNGDIGKSLEVIDQALQQPEGLADIAKLIADIGAESDLPEVIDILKRAIRKLPDNNFIALTLCGKYVVTGKFDDESTALFKQLHQRAPDNKDVIFGLAMGYINQDKYDRSTLAIFRRAFHEYSTNNDFLYALARTYASQDPPVNEALPVIERALKFFPDEELFTTAKIAILASLPVLTPEQIKILLDSYKKTKNYDLALKLVNHLLAMHADDEDACRVYEAVWKDHPKKTTLLSILAERYRMAGRTDPIAIEIFQAFFDEMPRERENTLNLARRYAVKDQDDEAAILVYQQSLRDGAGGDMDNVILALAHAYLSGGKSDEEAARIYRMAYSVEKNNYAILSALKDVAVMGGRMDGARANPLIDFIKHSETSEEDALLLSEKLGPALAHENRTDDDACHIYRMNVKEKIASAEEEALLAGRLIENKKTKMGDIPLLERVYARDESDNLAIVLSALYRETGEPDEKRLPIVIRALNVNPSDKKLTGWAIAYLLNRHGEDATYFPLLARLIGMGHLAGAKGIKKGIVARTVTRIARDTIREGNFADAIRILGEAFKFDKNPILQYLLGVSYQGSGDFQTGLEIFRNLKKSDKKNPAYSYRIAVLMLMSGNIKEAKKELSELKQLFPDHSMVHLRMGMIMETQGDQDGAIGEYEQVRSGDKTVVAFADYRRGIIHCMKKEWEEGLRLLETAVGGGIESQTLDSARMQARLTLVDSDIESASLDTAERRLNKLVEQAKSPWLHATCERLLRLALLHFINGDDKAAQRVLDTAQKTDIRDSRVASLIAMIDIGAGRPKAAIERLERVLSLRDESGSKLAHRLWTVISLRLGRHDEARDAAEWLLARNVEDAAKLRFLGVWRNPIEIDWPPALDGYTYDDLENEFGFPVGLIGRMAYKRADYEDGAEYLEKYFKDESKPDRVEAEFLLGLMYIKLKKPNLGLHYWSHILSEGHLELKGKQRMEGLMLLGYHFMEHGEPEKSREAFKLAGEAGVGKDEIEIAIAYSHLQAGYLQAKADNMQGAILEWEKILDSFPNHWQTLQNLGLVHLWISDDRKTLEYFNRLFQLCQDNPEAIDEEDFTFVYEETRKIINQLVSLNQTDPGRAEVKKEMLLDEIKAANRHYWTLGVKKGVTGEDAQANYFRLLKIYNPEKYPQDFMVLEKAYEFFNKPGLLKKNEQIVFNAFHFRQLGMKESGGLTEIPPSPQVIDFLRHELDPGNHVDFNQLLEDSLSRKEKLPQLNTSPDYTVSDYLASW